MIQDKNSEGYRIAEELTQIAKDRGKSAANERYQEYLEEKKAKGTPLKYWESLAIQDTVRELMELGFNVSRSRQSTGKRIKYTRNPSEAYEEAAEMSRKFHGREPKEVIELIEDEQYDDNLAILGKLIELSILTDEGTAVIPINFEKCKVLVCSTADGTNLVFKDGDQRLDLGKLFKSGLYQGEASFNKKYCIVGPVYSIVYWTDKHHLEGPKEQEKGVPYEHEFGEQSKKEGKEDEVELPYLVYDTVNERILMAGGGYEVREEGIWN